MNITHTFQKAGIYRLRLNFRGRPLDWTMILFHGANIWEHEVKYMPICQGSEIDVQINGDGIHMLLSHPCLVDISVEAVSACGIGMSGICAFLIRKYTNKRLVSGHRLKLMKTSPWSYVLLANSSHKKWHYQLLVDFVASEQTRAGLILSVPARYIKQSSRCVFAIFPAPQTIAKLCGCQNNIDRIIVALTRAQFLKYADRHDLECFKLLIVENDCTPSSALAEAFSKGLFDEMDYIGLMVDGLQNPVMSRRVTGVSQGFLYDELIRVGRDLFFGSKSGMDHLLAAFERHPHVDLIACPPGSLTRAFDARGVENFLPTDMGRNIWLRASSLKQTPESCEALQRCIFQREKTTRVKDGRQSHHLKSGFRILIPAGEALRDGESARLADYRVVRPLAARGGEKLALFVGYAPNGIMRPHAIHYMKQLRGAGFRVYALAANDRSDLEVQDPGPEACDGLATRENIGFDFALWAASIIENPAILDASDLLLVNDSVIGPLFPLDSIFNRVDESSADIIGLTDSEQIQYHAQSYFLYLKRTVISNQNFVDFVYDVRSYADKISVILEYEISFVYQMVKAGFSYESLFPSRQFGFPENVNPSIVGWRELLAAGFPFVKAELVRSNPYADNLSDLESMVCKHGSPDHTAAALEHIPYWPSRA